MIITDINIKNFRNIEQMSFSPHHKTNIIFGNNAQGKTNIIEAIWLMSGNKSFRAKQNSELIKFNTNNANIEVVYDDTLRTQKIKCNINTKIDYQLNSVKHTRSEMVGNFNCVVFSPVHMNLIKQGPNHRRKFIDIAISQIKPQYYDYITKYDKLIIQRNAILKNSYDNSSLIETYNEHISKLGTILTIYRNDYINKLKSIFYNLYNQINNNNETIELIYNSTVFENVSDITTYEEEHINTYSKLLKSRFVEDKKYGSTSVGVHRDDIVFNLNGVDARTYGSQGQQRSIIIALKLAEAHMLSVTKKQKPILLLDDVMSELDENRQKFIINSINDMQIFITCCDISNTLKLENGSVFNISNGNLKL